MSRQQGLVTRTQAVDVGCSERELRTLTARSGPWVVVRRGVYVEREQWDAAASVEQMRLRDLAAHLTMGRTHVLSHDSSGRSHSLGLLRPRRDLVHVTRPGVSGSRTEHGVKHHLYRTFNHVVYVDDMPVHDLARTAIDIGREHGVEAGVVALDQVLARGVTRQHLAATLGEMKYWPHITRAREAEAVADAGAESPGESLLRLVVLGLGHGIPRTQFPVRLHDRVVWCDLQLGCHVFEFDGKVKYLGRAHGGFASRPAEEVVWQEKVRERDVCAEGLGMSRVTWDDVIGARRLAVTTARLEREYQESVHRFGPRLPEHLAAYARQNIRHRRS